MVRFGPYLRARNRRAAAGIRRRRRAMYRGKKTVLKGFTRAQSNAIVKYVGRSDETKYFATQLAQNGILDAAIHTPGTDILPLCPPIPQGTGEFQRVGRKVTPTKCRVDISVTFPQADLGTPSPDITYSQANAIYVVMYIVRSKIFKNWPLYQTDGLEWQYLLDNGQGASTMFGQQITPPSGPSFYATNTQFLQYPIETSHYTLLKKKVVKLVRNQGFVRSAVSAESPNLPQSYFTGSFTYKLPKLIYDDTKDVGTGTYPTNANVMLMAGYAFADNLWSEDYVVAGSTTQASMPLLSWTVRNHVWYKDA